MKSIHTVSLRLSLVVSALALGACGSPGYTSLLDLEGGTDQKSVVLDSVRACREDQVAGQAEFLEAFQFYSQLVRPNPEDIEDLYDDFQDQVDQCAECVGSMEGRIKILEQQANQLFEGWSTELDQFANQRMRVKSEEMMIDTKKRYERLIAKLQLTHVKMDEVLVSYRDYILFFNHNLNARALSTLEDENARFLGEVHALKDQISSSRAECDDFVQALMGPDPSAEPLPAEED